MKTPLFVVALSVVAATSFASKVTNIELSYQNGETVARIDVSGPIRYTHQTVVPRDGKPDRVIVDILSATHELGGRVFEHVPPCPVTAVRTSQFSVKPEAVVRIVFDLKLTPVYQVETKDQAVYVHFTDKSVTAFPTWSTAQSVRKSTSIQASRPQSRPTASESKLTLPAQKNEIAEKDRVESLAVTPKSEPAVTANAPSTTIIPANSPDGSSAIPAETTATKAVAGDSTPQPNPTAGELSPTIMPESLTITKPGADSTTLAKTTSAKSTGGDTTPVLKPTVSLTPMSETPDGTMPPAPDSEDIVSAESTGVKATPSDTAPAVKATVGESLQTARTDVELPSKPKPDAAESTSAPQFAVTSPDAPAAQTGMPTAESSTVVNRSKPYSSAKGLGTSLVTPVAAVSESSASATTTGTAPTKSESPKSSSKSMPIAKGPVPMIATSVSKSHVAGTDTQLVESAVISSSSDSSEPVGVTPSDTTPPALVDHEEPGQPPADNDSKYAMEDDTLPPPEDLEPAEMNPYEDHDIPAGANWAEDSAADSANTARFRRHPLSAAQVKGTMIAQFPQRLVIKYQPGGARDPFETLIDETKTFNSPTKQGVPNIDGLHLVGVIISRKGGNRALLQDKSGYSYMLGSGDKVRNGYVVRIQSDRVYFQIFEYGWSRTVALKIDES